MEQPAAEVRGSAALDATEPGAHDARREARVRYLALLACINSVSLGYQIGAVTVSNGLVKRHLNLSNAQLAAYEASVNIAAIAGAALSSLISEQLGRRGVFLLAAFVFSAGSVVQALSWTYASLLVGILLVGLGVGIGLAIDPLYIAEISPPGGRGFFVTYSEAAIAAGQLLGYIIALIIDASLGSCACAWRLMLGLGVVPPACLAYAVIFVMPESPRWLARHGREEEARKVLEDDLQWDATRAQAILEDVRAEAAQAPAAGQTWLGLLHLARTKPAVRRMLLVGVGTAVAQQLSGTDALFYNYVKAADAVGFSRLWKVYATLVGFGTCKLLTAFASMYLLDTVGRRPLVVASAFATTTVLYLLALVFGWATDQRGNSGYESLVILLFYAYVIAFEIGLGPGCWLVPSECFYNDIRMRAMSLATFANRCTTTGVVGTAISIQRAWSWSGFYAWYGSVCLTGAVFLFLFLPETKGKSLEQMYTYFEKITGGDMGAALSASEGGRAAVA